MLQVQRGVVLETIPRRILPEDRSERKGSGVACREMIHGSHYWRYNMLSLSSDQFESLAGRTKGILLLVQLAMPFGNV